MWSPSGSGNTHVDAVISGKKRNMPYEIRMDGARHCVYKKGTDQKMGCHSTENEAKQQLAALYAAEGNKGMSELSFLVHVDGITLSEENGTKSSWVHALPMGTYQHPVYGPMEITSEKIVRLAESVNSQARGIEPSIHYGHQLDGSTPAAGWVKKAEPRSNGLWIFVEWVDEAAEKIKKKAYRYFSSEFVDEWVNPVGQKLKDIFVGGALTNRPFMKNLVPLNLSEAVIENAFDLVAGITGTPVEDLRKDGKENGMELSEDQLNKIIEGVVGKISDKLPKNEPPAAPPTTKLEDISGLKELAETNPAAKALVQYVESQGVTLHQMQDQLRKSTVTAKLSEFSNSSKMVLTPTTKETLEAILTHPQLPHELSEKIWVLMDEFRKGETFVVELGQRAGAPVNYGFAGDKSATQIFSERVNELMATKKLDFLTASEQVAREDPKLYEAYRAGDGAVRTS